MWDTWVCGQVQSVAQLVDKVGKTPGDRLCRKDLGIPPHSLPSYLQAVLTLLECMMEVCFPFICCAKPVKLLENNCRIFKYSES